MPETNIILYINYISIKNNLKRKEKFLILLNQRVIDYISFRYTTQLFDICTHYKGFPCGFTDKESACNVRDLC